ncbi:hypothetical protein AGDE_10558 [Angomonas deanei]|nr:hypothetical protein AGDE_10558 [Angomonas deanei]|eukprot:EPY28085.1 hypothetical protein AGDE_10558 [Angomonas deanei]
MTPSMLTKDVVDYLKSDGKEPVQQVVLWGHETHVCILQTADALLQQNIRVAICLDGCSAQRKIDHDAAVLSMSRWDGLVFSTPIGILLQLTQGDASLMTKEMMRLAKPEPHQEL